MKKFFLPFFAGIAVMCCVAAVSPFSLTIDANNRIPLSRNLVASNGVTVITNFSLKALDGPGFWRIVVTNATGGIGVVTNSGSN
jgi:hypothetical protein